MKKICLIIFLIISCFISKAQNTSCEYPSDYPVFTLDSFSFENSNDSFGRLIIDTTFPDNIWQIGTVQKSGFPNAFSGTNAIQTDTLNAYPINNESAFIVYSDSNLNWNINTFSLTFWHYYDTDSLTDSCLLQVTLDSGKTWSNIFPIQTSQGFLILYSGSLNNYSVMNDTLFWSGKSNGWVKESICAQMLGAKGLQIPRIQGFRFLFHSDSVQNNKPGWMIDNIVLKTPEILGSVQNIKNANSLLIYPNPSDDGIFNIDYPYNFVTGKIELYNIFGQKMKELKLSKTINISDLPSSI